MVVYCFILVAVLVSLFGCSGAEVGGFVGHGKEQQIEAVVRSTASDAGVVRGMCETSETPGW